ncbi:hypothetical protein V2E29_11735 [Streptomyces diastatochromogenes]|uniref:hypothetical protein n=1 Tax=Streptomyces diastatochromogenes TaxID=42236 RepID=UPI002F2678E7
MTASDTTADLHVVPGNAWLLSHSPDPAEARRLWRHNRFAPVSATAWRVAQGRCLRSLEAIRPSSVLDCWAPSCWTPPPTRLADGAPDHLVDIPILTLRPPAGPWTARP